MKRKSERRQRIKRTNEERRASYEAWVAKHGRVITYQQWLHPSMREPIEVRWQLPR